MKTKQIIASLHCLSLLQIFGSLLLCAAVEVVMGANSATTATIIPPEIEAVTTEQLGVVTREEFEALNSKITQLLRLLSKDGPFAETFRGPPGEPGRPGSPGPVGNPAKILAKLAELEGFQQNKIGKVQDAVQKNDTVIYFATEGGGGMKVYTESTNRVETFVVSREDLEGVAWDDRNEQLYFCSNETIYRARKQDGSVLLQTVFSSKKFGWMRGLALDWISGNLYGIGNAGHVFVCAPETTGNLNCATLVSGQGFLAGIAVDPGKGALYYTKTGGRIKWTEMDGTNLVDLVTGLNYPAGIAIDFISDRLFFVSQNVTELWHSKLDGNDIQLVEGLSPKSKPWGIAVDNEKDRLFLGNYGSKPLQRITKSGGDLRTLHSGPYKINHVVLATAPNMMHTRKNPCEGHSYANICVLNAHSFRCLS